MLLPSLLLSLNLSLSTPDDNRFAHDAPIRLISLCEAEPDLRASTLYYQPARPLGRIQSVSFKPEASAKGFILDLGIVKSNIPADSLRFQFVDARTLYAYTPSPNGTMNRTRIHFSHPYATFQIRKEKCLMTDGSRAPHCAIALTFKPENGRPVVITTF